MTGRLWLVVFAVVGLGSVCPGQGHRATFAQGAVAADHSAASEAGARMLRLGGNAVDAAVATSFALSVVRPESCGIGGGGFMVVYLPDDPTHGRVVTAINYRETAPGAARPDMFETTDLPEASTRSGLAVGVPGTVAGLLHALERYGTLDRATVLQPAIDLAVGGWRADATTERSVQAAGERLGRAVLGSHRVTWREVLGRGEVREGDLVFNPSQGAVLARVSALGRAGLYEGWVAERVVEAAAAHGGVLTLEDLASYAPVEVEPLAFSFRGMTVLSMPPPSSGGVTIAMTLGLLERLGWDGSEGSSSEAHLLVESLKHAFADRASWLADPAFVEVPVSMLVSGAYLDARAASVDRSGVLEISAYGTRPEGGASVLEDAGTSHLSVVDRWGGAVACTETINLTFGSMIAGEGLGFCLNNEMDDFTTVRGEANAFGLVQSDRNLPEPGKRPLSSMSPTIVLDAEGGVRAVAGGSGGPRIITGTVQALLNALVRRMDAGEAVGAPRMHHQWLPDVVRLEEGLGAEGGLVSGLEAIGHRVERTGGVGVVQLIVRDGAGVHAACDPRKGGVPAGH